MPPVPELDTNLEQMQKPDIPSQPCIDGDSVVISGMAGMFPMSNNVKAFSENLYNKVYMVTDELRFKHSHPELQKFCGNIPSLSPFDAQFFGVHARLSITMDPMSRKLLEQTYQAIYDAGLSIDHVRETKLGVFIGSCFSETEKACFYCAENRTGFGIMGCCKAMFANRISYWLDAKGPSMSLDCLCASSLVAFEHAVEAIRKGDCDAAIVGSSNVILHPQSSILFGRSLQLSADGKAKSFDKNADGTVRSESVNVLFIQKAKHAKRIYAEVCHVRCAFEAGSNEMFGPYRTVPLMKNFFTNFYREANVSPNQVEYLEAYGTAIPEADKNELQAIGEVFCKDRTEPLLVGSVISNMGYSEAATGISSIIKVCLGYHTGKYASNLHCDNPRDDVEALRDGRMRILTNAAATSHGYTAVNNFSIGGMNCHVLLKGYNSVKSMQKYNTNIPYLVTVSGRHEPAVQHVVDELKSHPVDAEEIALLQNIHERSTIGHMARGYCILTTNENNETKVLAEKNDYYADIKRPIWFVYSGMGSQWSTMGTELMRLPIFSAAIERCRRVLEPRGVNIVDIITNPDKTMFDNILHSFVGIAAVQIGLTDVLRELGIVPDKIIGHSVGELGCAYADGCFTAEEMILAAYSRGLVSVETPFIHGSMAAVGLGFNTVSKMCPPEIEVACHNSAESSTISGPSAIMTEFVAKLTAQGVFAKEVPCSNIAYHSRYIAEAGPKLKEYLSTVIKDPKQRSEKWVSTSVPQDRWNMESAKYSSAEYHTNNLLNPVLFEETSRLIPTNAVTIEIAPHGLLQAILKRSLGAAVTNIPLTRRGHSDPITFLLNAIGQMYMVGMNPKLNVLYPKIEFPISTGTGLLSHLIKWVHTEQWPLPIYAAANRSIAAQRNIVLSTHDDEYKYIENYVIDDQIVFPLSGILVLVWETLAMIHSEDKNLISVQINNLHYCKDALVHRDQLLRLTVTIQRGSGRFEVTKENNLLVHGHINTFKSAPQVLREEHAQPAALKEDSESYDLELNDIYKLMFRKGYDFRNEFRSIRKANFSFTKAELIWKNDWISFLDSILQLSVLTRDHSGVSRPKFIRKITIDTASQNRDVLDMKNNSLKAVVKSLERLVVSGGVAIEGIEYIDNVPLATPLVLKKYEFMPFNTVGTVSVSSAFHAHLQIVAKNINSNLIKTVEIKNAKVDAFGKKLYEVSQQLIGFDLSLKRVAVEEFLRNDNLGHIHLLLGYGVLTNESVYKELAKILPNKAFILSIEASAPQDNTSFTIIASANTSIGQLFLIKWHPVIEPTTVTCLSVDNDCALLKYTKENLKASDRLIITSKYPAESGLIDLVGQWSKDNKNIQLYLSDEKMISDQHFYEGSKRNLTFNVFKNGIWGSEFYLPIEDEEVVREVKLTNIPGYLDCLKWVEIPNVKHSTNQIRVKVHYAGPTFYDIQKASGQITSSGKVNSYGMDFSGVTQTGTKVMGLISEGSVGSSVEADRHFLWPVPEHWTLEDAATVPLPYVLAFYCLCIKTTKLVPGSNVLIHGGAGALGQAAISIALGLRCKVFTTVNSIQKKKFVMKLFPELPEENIGNSRNISFETMVLIGTASKGCRVVLNSLKGELREASMRCVGYTGDLVDVNAHDLNKNMPFNMHYLSLERNYKPAILNSLFETDNREDKAKLQRLLIEGINQGYVRPLSRVTYSPQDVARAFKLLATSSHRGRVLIRMNEMSSLTASPSLICSPHSSYIVLCGKNEFGIDIADRLVVRGARNLILHCDTTLNTGLLRQRINSWKEIGIKVILNIEPLDANNNGLKLLNKSIGVGPVDGVFVVDEYKMSVLEGLDKDTRKMCPQLKHFAIIRLQSSDFEIHEKRILNERNKINLPILLLQYPALEKFEEPIANEELKIIPQNIHSALSALEVALRLKQPLPICTYAVSNADVDILNDISNILGVNVTNKVSGNTSLRDLGLDMEKAELISKYLDRVMRLTFDRDDVEALTISKLQAMCAPIYDKTKKEAADLSMFFTKVDPEELDATIDMVMMETLIASSTQRHDEFDADETYLVVIPGLEGHYAILNTLCERLKVPAVVLQPLIEYYNDSVEQIALRLLEVMKKNMNLTGKKYYLLGYSFGALVAMEMASLLEAQGLVGTVYCVDSAPGVFHKQLNRVIGHMTEAQLQDAIAEHMFSIMGKEGLDALKQELKLAQTWNEKVTASLKHLKGRVPHSVQYARLLIESAYGRVCAARKYDPNNLLAKKLNSQIVLLKARVPEELSDLEYDYGLSKYCQGKVAVYELDCDHLGTPQDLRCSNIINRHLGEDIIKAFTERNLCDTYLENPTQFIGISQ